jgi:hypothetical protein
MDACDATLSMVDRLNERIARQVFAALPEGELVLAIMDGLGNCWPSEPEAFARLGLDDALLGELRNAVDDGADPVRVQAGKVMVTAAQLVTEETNCGYLILVECSHGDEPAWASQDVVEALFGQITLAARLIERTSRIGDAQMKCYSVYGTCSAPAN